MLFELLEKYTDPNLGSWELRYNDHHTCYINKEKIDYEKRVQDYYVDPNCYNLDDIEERNDYEIEIRDFKFTCPLHNDKVYVLIWYKDTPVGHYRIYGASLEDIEKQVKELLNV